jgi:hypothetical protein
VALAAKTSGLTREAAYEALRSATSRPAAIVGASPFAAHEHGLRAAASRSSPSACPAAAVYEYWLDKRKRLGKPALRRLQPPPAVTDPNPFNVFRPREKLHRHGQQALWFSAFHRLTPRRHPQAADAPAA